MYREPEGDAIPWSGGGPVGVGEGSNPPTCPGIPIRFGPWSGRRFSVCLTSFYR